MRQVILSCALALLASTQAVATVPGAPVLERVVVSGIRPGPGLWKVSRGPNDLWILGTVSPIPRGMEWYSPRSEAVLRETQEIIGRPGASITVGVGSAFKLAFAVPAMLRARELPEGKNLRDVLPPDLYARWLELKPRYLGKDKDVERWRPMFAADRLYVAALGSAGLQAETVVGKRIAKLADKYDIRQTRTSIDHKLDDPKGLAKSFRKTDMDEVACFRSLLDRLDQDVAHAARRANAWAVGDVAELSRLVRRDRRDSCLEAIREVPALREAGLLDAPAQSRARWIGAAEAALLANKTSFATLPMNELLDDDGLLEQLRARGYRILPPG